MLLPIWVDKRMGGVCLLETRFVHAYQGLELELVAALVELLYSNFATGQGEAKFTEINTDWQVRGTFLL